MHNFNPHINNSWSPCFILNEVEMENNRVKWVSKPFQPENFYFRLRTFLLFRPAMRHYSLSLRPRRDTKPIENGRARNVLVPAIVPNPGRGRVEEMRNFYNVSSPLIKFLRRVSAFFLQLADRLIGVCSHNSSRYTAHGLIIFPSRRESPCKRDGEIGERNSCI